MRGSQHLFFWIFVCALSLGSGEVWGSTRVLWEIRIVEAEIKPTKANGRKWDWGFPSRQAPDPFVIIEGGGQKFTTQARSDTYRPRWKQTVLLKLSEDARIHIRVFDKDQRLHDLIGQMDAGIKELEIKKKWSFGQVAWLRLEVKRKHDTPIAWVDTMIRTLRVNLTAEQKARMLALGQQYDRIYAKTLVEKKEAAARLGVQLGAKYRDVAQIEKLQQEVSKLELALVKLFQDMRSEVQKILRPEQWKDL